MGRRNTFSHFVQVSTVPREEMSNFSNRKSCCIDFRGSSPFTLHPDNRPDRGIYDKYTGRELVPLLGSPVDPIHPWFEPLSFLFLIGYLNVTV